MSANLENRVDWASRIESWQSCGLAERRKDLLGPASRRGIAYRWGIAIASGVNCSDAIEVLSRLAVGSKVPKALRDFDLERSLRHWFDVGHRSDVHSPIDAAVTLNWAAALPCLVDRINEIDLQRIGDELVHLHSGIIDGGRVADPTHLLLGAELGWELANLTRDDEISRLFVASSTRALQDWCQHGSEALPNSIHLATNARLVLASLVRCKKLLLVGELSVEDRQKWKQIGRQLSLWVATLVCHDGSNAFAHLERQATVDDHCSDGLLAQAVKFDRDSLEGAVSAALGNAPKNPGLTWEVSLPEAMLHDTDGKLAILLPQWNVRSGRTHVDYSAAEVDLELFSGKKPLISGRLKVDLQIDGKSQEPLGQWEEVCEYTDDDVHYLEIEQEWTGNAMLQRQFLLIREDRSFVFADAVIPKDDSASLGRIDYSCRLPLMDCVDSPNQQDWVQVDFGTARSIHTVKIFVLDDRDLPNSAVLAPRGVQLEAKTDNGWKPISFQCQTDVNTGHRSHSLTFEQRSIQEFRVIFDHAKGGFSGLTELEAWGESKLPIEAPAPPKGNLAFNRGDAEFPTASCSYHDRFGGLPESAIDGITNFLPTPTNRWTSYESPNESDWLEINFGKQVTFTQVDLAIYDDRGGVQTPLGYEVEVWNDTTWVRLGEITRSPLKPLGSQWNTATFSSQTTDKLRIVFQNRGRARSGVSEVMVWNNQ
ncbi:discoidin domain-containing protein [Rubripirellula sp.]|nr:discoidin domain-containing protein [Rubripirellula sp.]MDB4338833.1 discoidin domain-containing protein [Rubripirellula sp.]